jgi:hypothetical protein
MNRNPGFDFPAGLLALGGLVLFLAGGCDRPGPMEQVGEEVDEAVETLKDGGESTANKLDDAMDDLRDGVEDATDELQP